jgi:hypothetical protein
VRSVAAALLLAASPAVVDFRNSAREAGLVQSVPNGGAESKKFIIETTGSGAALFDYDNDGLLDAFLVSGPGAGSRLYRNTGGGRFQDVTKAAGLERQGWGQGVCAGDFDNDGYTDLLVTYWGQNSLYRNVGGKRFQDVTSATGLRQQRVRYNTGCAFLDSDNDGKLDIFIANYLRFDFDSAPKPGENPFCFYRSIPVACGPRGLSFDRNLLYHNNGDGTFTDVSEQSGIAAPAQNYSLGVAVSDVNNDGKLDIYVACDQTASILYINQGDGRFRDEALLRGAAYDADGKALSGMGVAAGDVDGDGWSDIFRTNFSDERETLYRNRGGGDFEDATFASGMAHNTRFVGWGCGFFDFDRDGWKDLLLVNGHVFPEVDRLGSDVRYRDRAVLYRNVRGRFQDVSEASGSGIVERHSSRGAAFGDVDNDGSIDILINNQNEPPSLLKSSHRTGNWVQLRLEGTTSNRSAIGARVLLTSGGRTQTDEVRSGGSYLSQNDFRLHFGVANESLADLEVRWPAGGVQKFPRIPVNRNIVIREGAPGARIVNTR